jgi:hypothetical protein
VGGDFGVDLLHRELIETNAFRVIANLLEGGILGGDGFDVVGNAHDQDSRFSIAFNEETLVVIDGAIHDLTELGAGNVS